MAELDYDYLAELVVKAQQGSSDAFAELYAATYRKQYKFAYQYVKDAYLAQDILQEVYILVLKNIKKIKNPKLFISWLNQINFRICFDVYQKQKRQVQELNNECTDAMEHSHGEAPSPEQQIAIRSEQEDLMEKILTLPTKEAQAIFMKYYHDMSVSEIADSLECGYSTAKRYLASGRTKLGKLLENQKGGADIG